MNKDFFYECIKYKPTLFKAILSNFQEKKQLNCQILAENYQSLDLEKNPILQKILANHKISSYLIFANNLNHYKFDFADEKSRLIFLNKEETEELAKIFGIALYSKDIAKIIKKTEIEKIKQFLGLEYYNYALERGQYQLSQNYFKDIDEDKSLEEKIFLHGKYSLYFCNPKLDLGIDAEDLPAISEKIKNSLYFVVKKILIQEVDRAWQQCLD